jgi:hypothetical protein
MGQGVVDGGDRGDRRSDRPKSALLSTTNRSNSHGEIPRRSGKQRGTSILVKETEKKSCRDFTKIEV